MQRLRRDPGFERQTYQRHRGDDQSAQNENDKQPNNVPRSDEGDKVEEGKREREYYADTKEWEATVPGKLDESYENSEHATHVAVYSPSQSEYSKQSIKNTTEQIDEIKQQMIDVVREERTRSAQFSPGQNHQFVGSHASGGSRRIDYLETDGHDATVSATNGSFALGCGIYLLRTIGKNIYSPEVQRRRLRNFLTQRRTLPCKLSIDVDVCVRYSIKSFGVKEQSQSIYSTEPVVFESSVVQWKDARFVEKLDKGQWTDASQLFPTKALEKSVPRQREYLRFELIAHDGSQSQVIGSAWLSLSLLSQNNQNTFCWLPVWVVETPTSTILQLARSTKSLKDLNDSRILAYLRVYVKAAPIDEAGYEVNLHSEKPGVHYAEIEIPEETPLSYMLDDLSQQLGPIDDSEYLNYTGQENEAEESEHAVLSRANNEYNSLKPQFTRTSAVSNGHTSSTRHAPKRNSGKTSGNVSPAREARMPREDTITQKWDELSSVTEEDTSDSETTRYLKRLKRKTMDLRAETAGLRSAVVRAQTKRNQTNSTLSKLQLMQKHVKIQQRKVSHKMSKQRSHMKERLQILREGSPFAILDVYEAQGNEVETKFSPKDKMLFEQSRRIGYPEDGYDVSDIISKTSASLAAMTGNFGLGLDIPKRVVRKSGKEVTSPSSIPVKNAKKRIRALRRRVVSMHSQLRSLLLKKANTAQDVHDCKSRALTNFEIWDDAAYVLRRVAAHHLWRLYCRGENISDALGTFEYVTRELGITIVEERTDAVQRVRIRPKRSVKRLSRPRSASAVKTSRPSSASRPRSADTSGKKTMPLPRRKSPYCFEDTVPEDRLKSLNKHGESLGNEGSVPIDKDPLTRIERYGVSIDSLQQIDKLHSQKHTLEREKRVIGSNISVLEKRVERQLQRILQEVEKLNSRNDREQEKLVSLEAEEASLDRRRQEMLGKHAKSVDPDIAGFSTEPVCIPLPRELNSAASVEQTKGKSSNDDAYSFGNISRAYENEIAILEAQLRKRNAHSSDQDAEAISSKGSKSTDELAYAAARTDGASHEVSAETGNQKGHIVAVETATGVDSESSSEVLSKVTWDSD